MKEINDTCYTDYKDFLLGLLPKGESSALILKNAEKFSNNFYVSYPFLFASYFPSVTREKIRQLTLCGNIFMTWIRLFDRVVDQHVQDNHAQILWLLNDEYMLRMHELFPSGSPYWIYYLKYRQQTIWSAQQERASIEDPKSRRRDSDDLIQIAQYKSAFAKCATAGLMVLANGDEDPFVESQDHFHAGLQMMDDLQDWKEDLEHHHRSYLYSILDGMDTDAVLHNAIQQKDYQIVGKYIFFTDVVIEILGKAKDCYERSLACVRRADVPLWHELVQKHLQRCLDLIKYYSDEPRWIIKKANKVKQLHADIVHENFVSGSFEASVNKGLGYILIEENNGYPELQHRLLLPDPAASDNAIPVIGTLFQRMIVLENLLEIKDLFHNDCFKHLLENEISTILHARFPFSKGGWSYFPDYRWLPPDADSLSQVIKLLTSIGYPNAKEVFAEPLKLLLTHNQYETGFFKTWILNPEENTPVEKSLKRCVHQYWGEYFGKDVEVTMNVLLALSMLDDASMRPIIDQGLAAVFSAQLPEGCWKSGWYAGDYFAAALMAKLSWKIRILSHEGVQKLSQYVLATQKADGGWGDKHSDPLNTSFALIALFYIHYSNAIDEQIIDKAKTYLLHSQKQNGAWDPVKFICMPIEVVPFRSATITTSYVVRALSLNFQ